jgi:hypothetical protein
MQLILLCAGFFLAGVGATLLACGSILFPRDTVEDDPEVAVVRRFNYIDGVRVPRTDHRTPT